MPTSLTSTLVSIPSKFIKYNLYSKTCNGGLPLPLPLPLCYFTKQEVPYVSLRSTKCVLVQTINGCPIRVHVKEKISEDYTY